MCIRDSLHGGQSNTESANNELFFKQFTELVKKDHVKILLCYFAREKKSWSELFENDKVKIIKQSTKKVEINIVETIEQLRKKLQEVDVLYFSGGEEEFLRPYMTQLSFLKEAIRNKIFVGSSMWQVPCKLYVSV